VRPSLRRGLRDRPGHQRRPGRDHLGTRTRHRDPGLHESRAGGGEHRAGRPRRPLQPGLRAVPDAGGGAAVHRCHRACHHRQAAERDPALAAVVRPPWCCAGGTRATA
jgi:hypothetical protein